MFKPSDKKETDRHDSYLYWPTSIKDTMQWFLFLTIMEHTANILNPDKGLIHSLLKLFAMFQLNVIDEKYEVEAIATSCINGKKETGLYLRISTFEEMITKFVLNAILYNVGMSWIVCSNEKMRYEIDKINHPDWLNKGSWYNTEMFSKFHGRLFEYFITHAITDRYNIMCSIVAHDKKQPAYKYEETSIGDRLITKHVTPEALEELGATFNFINIWSKLLDDNYDARRESHNISMKEMLKKIPTMVTKPLSQKQKVQKLMT